MALLNYTTKIPVDRTVGEIQKMLARAGAEAVLTEYGAGGELVAISFRMQWTPRSAADMRPRTLMFRLPARVEAVERLLHGDRKRRPTPAQREQQRAQAQRVAWRIVKDWIEAQIALVQAEQAELAEVFLPYAQDRKGRTLYQALDDGELPLLTGPEA